MDLRAALAGAMLMLAGVAGASGQETIDGSNADEILNIARGYGSATLTTQDNGDPRLDGKIDGVQYYVLFRNCTNNTACEDLNFYAGFLDNKPTLEAINAWNRDKRFAYAYLDFDLDASIVYDVNIEYGVTPKNLDATFSIWSHVLNQYADYIGFQR
jgi:hypothetical protein